MQPAIVHRSPAQVRPHRSTLLPKRSFNRSEQNEVEWKWGDNTCITENACAMQSFNEGEVHFQGQIDFQIENHLEFCQS